MANLVGRSGGKLQTEVQKRCGIPRPDDVRALFGLADEIVPLQPAPCMPKKPDISLRNEAWIGDAVLGLFARKWILREQGQMNGDTLAAFTSNHFLSGFGNPTAVEAEIGRIYEEGGLAAAFSEIESRFLPSFLAQEKRRKRQQRH